MLQSTLALMASCLRTKNATEMVNQEWNGVAFGIMNCPFVPVLDGEFFPGDISFSWIK